MNNSLNIYKFKAYGLYYIVTIVAKLIGISIPPLPATFAIIRKGKKILAVKLSYKNGYAFPGGGLEQGETFEEALKREVFEETGLRVTKLKYFGSYVQSTPRGVSVAYEAEAKGKLRTSEEGTPEWIDSKKIRGRLVFRDNRAVLRDLFKK